MILIDTGPLIALLDKDDSHHQACVTSAAQLPPDSLMTTWPCFTEAMYLLGAVGGFHYQAHLWRLRSDGRLELYDFSQTEVDRMASLMQRYQDTPMDLADASVVVAAEGLGVRRVFTLDSDFRVYRLADGSAFDVVP